MSEINRDDPQSSDAAVSMAASGTVCCVRCHRQCVGSTGLADHYERAHKRHNVTMEPGELDAVIELIRARLVTERTTGVGPRSERERHLWNFFVRHDKRLKKLWTFLNSPETDLGLPGDNDEDPRQL